MKAILKLLKDGATIRLHGAGWQISGFGLLLDLFCGAGGFLKGIADCDFDDSGNIVAEGD